MRKSSFIKHLQELNEEELRKELELLYSKIPEVKQFYSMELGSEKDRNKLYEKTKKEIKAKYATKSLRKPRRPRIQKINKLLSEMERLSIFSSDMIELHLFNVEEGLRFAISYSFSSVPLNNCIINSFEKAVQSIVESKLDETYRDKCKSFVERSILHYPVYHRMKSAFEQIETD
jgi:hypothetical protein